MSQQNIDIYLVNMPVSPIQRPSIALGTLSALMKRQGLAVKTLYANMWFAEFFGMDVHQKIGKILPQHLLGEWLFSEVAFPGHSVDDDTFLEGFKENYGATDILQRIPDWENFRQMALNTKKCIPDYMDWVVSKVLSANPAIVGCTSVFQQNVAALALLRKLKEARPGIVTMMGGANCETIMGKTIHENFDWVDYVASGEVDEFIGPFCQTVIDGKGKGELAADQLPEGVFGPVHRRTGYPTSSKSYDGFPRAIANSLQDAPPPDYDDYFAELQGNYLSTMIIPGVPFEGARGCWWGFKSHCTFCGLNGVGMNYREKTVDQVEAELAYLADRYGVTNFSAVDNIMSLTHLKNLLPRLVEKKKNYMLFFETKANLKKNQIAQFFDANVRWIQPGIESLSTEVLGHMKKGVKAWQNIQTLKYATQYGINLSWNVLCGFPGEKDEWYKDMAALPAKLAHLEPGGFTMLRLDRYSVYHRNPAAHGLDLMPFDGYGQIYPLASDKIKDLAYFFYDGNNPIFNAKQATENQQNRPWLRHALEGWREWSRIHTKETKLVRHRVDGDVYVRDTRQIAAAEETMLTGLEDDILTCCDAGPTERDLLKALPAFPDVDVTAALQRLKNLSFVIEIDGRLLSLVLEDPVEDFPRAEFMPFGTLIYRPLPN